MEINSEWLSLEQTPPDEFVEVMDKDGNIAFAQPTYFPFVVEKREGDENKRWGWRGTPVFHEDGKSHWDGGWMIKCIGLTNKVGNVISWRKITKDNEK